MLDLTLGLDLGSNSIGWSLLDEAAGKIVAAGVRVFPEGVDRDTKGGELSKNESRRIARGMRRQIARRARRKKQLRAALITAGLLPADAAEQLKLDGLDPFDLRRRALDEKLSLHEIGRAVAHLNQRRGFLSNRKADRARKKENSEMLAEISALAKEMQDAGHRTLGEHMATLVAKPGEVPQRRVRGRHTRREMFIEEFNAIWASQQKHHLATLSDELKQRLYRIIFFQRAMYWPASVIGHCEIEPRLPRCPRADRRAQRFRLFQEVNNLRLLDTSTGIERKLTEEERTHLLALLSKTKELKFDAIRKKMNMLETVRFNLERGDRDKLKGLPADATLSHKDLFGKSWASLPEDDKNRLVSALITEDENYIRRIGKQLSLDATLIESLTGIDLGEGYASYSLHAIKKLLPHLERGLPLSSRDGSPCALSEAGYILPWQRVPNQQKYLPEPPTVTNPLVRHALHEVRKVVNAILRDLVYNHGHKLANIHIELAREIKGTAEQRRQQSFDMRDREAQRDLVADEIRKHGDKVTREKIERYRLWEEQSRLCIYSGLPISLVQLLGGEIDIDHILPRPRSLDDSFSNLVVCFRKENADKGDRTPYEWLANSNPAKFEQVLQRATRLPYNKAKRFRQPTVSLDDFFARQFVDTTYITTQVQQYVRCLGADVVSTKGQHTADLRWHWGLDSVLRHDGLELKNRDDHRHHAVDAIVIALTNRSRLQQLAGIRRRGGTEQTGEAMPEPWPEFRPAVEETVNQINVSHRVQRKVKGALHKDTIYGTTAVSGEFVVRKPIEVLTPAMIDEIRDPTIKLLVVNRLRERGIEQGSKEKLPKDLWKEPLRMKSGVPVRKVRLIRRDRTIQPIRGGAANVKPGSIHHLCLFEFKDTRGKTKRDAVFVSMLEAINRLKDKRPIIERTYPGKPDAKFVMSIAANEFVMIKHGDHEALCRFETAASTSQQMWFRHHTAAGKSAEKLGIVSKMPGTFEGRKVTVDPIGRIRWAND